MALCRRNIAPTLSSDSARYWGGGDRVRIRTAERNHQTDNLLQTLARHLVDLARANRKRVITRAHRCLLLRNARYHLCDNRRDPVLLKDPIPKALPGRPALMLRLMAPHLSRPWRQMHQPPSMALYQSKSPYQSSKSHFRHRQLQRRSQNPRKMPRAFLCLHRPLMPSPKPRGKQGCKNTIRTKLYPANYCQGTK